MKEPRLAEVFSAFQVRGQRQRHMDGTAELEESREHLAFLRIEEDKAIHPDFCAAQKRRMGNLLDEQLHHVFCIIITPLHGLLERLFEKSKVA